MSDEYPSDAAAGGGPPLKTAETQCGRDTG